jgi:hypothetical protein
MTDFQSEPPIKKPLNLLIIQNSNKIRDLYNLDLIDLDWLNDFDIVRRKLIRMPKFYSQIRSLCSGFRLTLKIIELLAHFYLYLRIGAFNLFTQNNQRNAIVTSDFFEPFNEKVYRVPKSTHLWFNFWWNNAYEVNHYLKYLHKVPNNIDFFNILPQDGTKIDYKFKNFYFCRYSNFSLVKISLIKTNLSKPIKQSVFAGEFRVDSPILKEILKEGEYYKFKNNLFEFSKTLNNNRSEIYKINDFMNLIKDKIQFVSQLKECESEIENLTGNFMRINFLNTILDSEFGNSTLVFTNNLQNCDYFSKNLLKNTHQVYSKYDLSGIYSNSKVLFDFGSRYILHPLISYERTCQLIKHGCGILRYSDVENPIFSKLSQRRVFESEMDLLDQVQNMFNQENEKWEMDGFLIKDNLTNFRENYGKIRLPISLL